MCFPTRTPTVSASSPSTSTAWVSMLARCGVRRPSPTSACISTSGRATCCPGEAKGRRMGKNHPNVDDYVVSRVRALESLLLEKGILAPDAVDRVIQRYEADTGPMIGARAVARAWVDPDYKRRLLDEPTVALRDFGLGYEMLVVVENTDAVHNLVVC